MMTLILNNINKHKLVLMKRSFTKVITRSYPGVKPPIPKGLHNLPKPPNSTTIRPKSPDASSDSTSPNQTHSLTNQTLPQNNTMPKIAPQQKKPLK